MGGQMFVSSLMSYAVGWMAVGFFAVASLSGASSAIASDAQDQNQDPYFTISSVTVEELPDTASQDWNEDIVASTPIESPPPVGTFPHPVIPPTNQPVPNPLPGSGSNLPGKIGQITGAINNIVNTGKLIWSIIEANKPVVNVSTDIANAIPQASSTWDSLGGWSAPQTKLFHVSYKNGFGSSVVDFTYRVIYLYAGNVDGKGHFLNDVSIVPADLNVAWGYTFTAKATVPSVTNAGTKSDPIAAMELQMQWSVSTMVKSMEQTENYYIRGDGQFSSLQ